MRRIVIALICLLVPLMALGEGATDTFTDIPPAYPIPETAQALLEVAIGELGYTEGRGGETKYGTWYGDAKAEWCAEFLCWSGTGRKKAEHHLAQ